jgi:hypothetical protein
VHLLDSASGVFTDSAGQAARLQVSSVLLAAAVEDAALQAARLEVVGDGDEAGPAQDETAHQVVAQGRRQAGDQGERCGHGQPPLTWRLSAAAAVSFTPDDAPMVMASPLCGLRPCRSARSTREQAGQRHLVAHQ